MTTDVAEAASPPDRRSGRAAVLMASGTALSRLTGLARLAVAAYALGFGSLADVFNLANTMPNIVHDLVLDGVLSATFVPVFVHELATRDRDEAVESIAAVVTLSAVLLAISTVIFIAIAPLIASLYFGGNGDSQGVATELLVLFAPQLLCYGTISLITALLNTERRFAAPMFVPILNNLIAIATLVVFAHMSHGSATSTHAIGGARLFLLGAGTTIAVAVQALALLPSMIRSRFRLRPVWRPHDPAVRSILRLSGWTFGFVVANQIAMFVVLVLAAKLETLEHGAVSVYTYGFTFFQLPFGIIAVSVMSAISPELTELYSRKDLAGFRSRFGSGTRQILGLIVPSAVGYLILAPSLMTLLLRHYSASAGGVNLTASVVALFALGLPGFCAYLLAIRAFQAMRDTRTAFYLYLFENGCNIAVAIAFFVADRNFGVRGLALSLSIAYTAAAVVAFVVLRIRVGGVDGRATLRSLSRVLTLSAFMAIVAAILDTVVGADHGAGLVLRVVAAVAGGALAYFGAAGVLARASSAWQTARRRQSRSYYRPLRPR